LKKVASFTWSLLSDVCHLPCATYLRPFEIQLLKPETLNPRTPHTTHLMPGKQGYKDARHTTHGTLLRAQSTGKDQLEDTRTNPETVRTSGKIPACEHNADLTVLSVINNFYLYH
jgi:hypothetical protein